MLFIFITRYYLTILFLFSDFFLDQKIIKSSQINLFKLGKVRSGCPISRAFLIKLEERGKPEYLEKNLSGQRRGPTTNSTHMITWSLRIEPQVASVGGKCSHHCTIPAPQGWFFDCLRHDKISIFFDRKLWCYHLLCQRANTQTSAWSSRHGGNLTFINNFFNAKSLCLFQR